MPRKSPGAKTKGLGAELRKLRQAASMTIEQGAAAIGKSKQVVSRLETGQRSISSDEVAGLVALYATAGVVTSAKREQLLTMARTQDDPGWWELQMPGLTQESATLADYEDSATSITSWAPLLVPGLLQTVGYARAFMLEDGIELTAIEPRITARLRRQARLRRPDVHYLALIGEPALIGDDAIDHEQLDALVEASARPNISIRVVPMTAMPRIGRTSAFLVLDQPGPAPTVVHVELARSGAFLDEPALTEPYQRTVARLATVALDETESLRRIVQERDKMET